MKIVVCKKCDDIYPICSAASICAKVTRDEQVAAWEFPEVGMETMDRNWGSGYPGDPKCKEWLQGKFDPVFGLPNFARFSWSTVAELAKGAGVKVDWKDDDEDDATQLALSFVPEKKRQKRFRFFRDRQLTTVE